MATIELYAKQINQMPRLIQEAKKSVTDYKAELSSLQTKFLFINRSVCNLDSVISSIQSSTQTQEQTIASLDAFYQNSENFIADVVRIDGNVADVINERKDNFYDEYSYLKPESLLEKVWNSCKSGLKKVGQWCREHWKEIVTAIIVIAAIACLFIPGINTWVLGLVCKKLILAIAVSVLKSAVFGGLLGGTISAITGGSFWEGFRDGAFSSAIAGIIGGGMGFLLSNGGRVALTLGQTLKIGAASGIGISFISDLGDKFIKGEDISYGQILLNIGISGTLGVVFAGIGYGLSKAFNALKLKIFNKPAAGDINYMKSSDPFYKYASRRSEVDPSGCLDIIAHGNPNGIEMVVNGNRQVVDYKTAARLIQSSPSYNGQNIRLLSCSTGYNQNGFAQNLANKLGVTVSAPSDLLWCRPDGTFFVAAGKTNSLGNLVPDLSKPLGGFIDFMPGNIIK